MIVRHIKDHKQLCWVDAAAQLYGDYTMGCWLTAVSWCRPSLETLVIWSLAVSEVCQHQESVPDACRRLQCRVWMSYNFTAARPTIRHNVICLPDIWQLLRILLQLFPSFAKVRTPCRMHGRGCNEEYECHAISLLPQCQASGSVPGGWPSSETVVIWS